jgi:phosphomannomutase/phosphoglucomutase
MTPEFVTRLARAAGATYRAEGHKVVALARDTRRTGPMLTDAAAAGLAAVGCDIRRVGVLPTPGLQAYSEQAELPAIMITASHNPPAYNGIKLIGVDGCELSATALERVEQRLLTASDTADATEARPSWTDVGKTERIDNARRQYIDQLLTSVRRDQIAEANLTVALDPGHGAGALTSPSFFRRLGCRVVTVNAQPDGHFPGRNPEPVAVNLSALSELVRATGADVGVAHDGDADRAIFFDEQGEYLEGDSTLAALAAASLEPGDATVSAVNVSQRLADVADERGAELELTPIGSTHIITRIRDLRAEGQSVPVAGEGNGGVLFPSYRLARDGAYTAARFLELLVDRPASEVVAPHAGYENVRLGLEYETDAERTMMLAAAESHAADAAAELTTIDGYRIDYDDAWVLARPSGTEPLIRVYAEARSHDRAETLASALETTMRSTIE